MMDVSFDRLEYMLGTLGAEWWADIGVNTSGSHGGRDHYRITLGGPGYARDMSSRSGEGYGELFARAISHARKWQAQQCEQPELQSAD